MEATDDIFEQGEQTRVCDARGENSQENLLVYGGEEFADVAFEHPAGTGIILRYAVRERAESRHGLVCSFFLPAGIRISNESVVEERIELPIESVVEEAVANTRFVDVARFWIVDLEMLISAVRICFVLQILMELQDVMHE